MRSRPLSSIVRAQIRKELARVERRTGSETQLPQNSQWQSINLQQDDGILTKVETLLMPLIAMLLDKRIMDGLVPTKTTANSLQLFIGSGVASFDQDTIVSMPAQEITLPTYTEDRWVYVYLESDSTYVVNKYSPSIGDNTDRIPICRVWVEHDATDYDGSLLRDLRQVGVASGNINHVLRQVFVNQMEVIPTVFTQKMTVTPYTESGVSDLMVYCNANLNSLHFGSKTPLPEEAVVIPLPLTGSVDYIVFARATIDNLSADDLLFRYEVHEKSYSASKYEIPVALIKNITPLTTEITSDMIEIIGYQKIQEDYYTNDLEFEDKPMSLFDLSDVEVTSGHPQDGDVLTYNASTDKSSFQTPTGGTDANDIYNYLFGFATNLKLQASPYYKIVNGVVDGLGTEDGIELTNCINETFYETEYTNFSSTEETEEETEKLVSSTVTADSLLSYIGTGYLASNVIDGNLGTYWASSFDDFPHWIKFQLLTEEIIIKIVITSYGDGDGRCGKNFTIQGSNNDSTWTDIYTDILPSGTTTETYTYTFENSTHYLYYRIYFIDNWRADSIIVVNEIRGYGNYGQITQILPMTLISKSWECVSSPTKGYIIIEGNIDSSTVLNSDIIVSMSKDNGSTWSQVILTNLGESRLNYTLMGGTVEFETSSDKTCLWKIETTDNYTINIATISAVCK
jgi:hypothetical protein